MKMFLTCIGLILSISIASAENEIRCGFYQVSKYLIVSLSNEDRVGSIAKFSCSRNATLVGSATSTCQPDGSWSNLWSACEVECLLDNLAFPGLLLESKPTYKDGEVFEFKCDPRYKEASSKQFKCVDGNWLGPIPPCIAGSCTKPVPSVDNAKAEVSSTRHSSLVKYICEDPFVLVETSQVQCLFGEWEGQPPRCEIGRCYLKDLQHVENLSAQTTNSTISGAELTVKCEVGYHPIVEKPLCMNGKWTRNFKPLCKISSCVKAPPAIDHATAVITSTSHTSVLRYVCKHPYTLVGNSQIRCLYGEWRGQKPKCEDTRCYLKDLDYSEGVSVDTKFVTNTGEELNVICKPEYDTNPVKPFCSNGKWTKNSVPLCTEKALASCLKTPPLISNARVIITSRKHGSVVKYACEDPFVQVGASRVLCVNGEWSGEFPRCIDSRCYLKDLQKAENIAPATPRVTLSGQHLNVICAEGYTIRPVKPLCLNGIWNRNFISPCKEITCNKYPPKVKHAVEEIIPSPVRTIVNYRCKDPYILEGNSQIECLFGEWKGQLPTCKEKNCTDPPPNVIHATAEIESTSEGKFAKYVCKEPYILVGNSEVQCVLGNWNGTVPKCKDSRCYLADLEIQQNLSEDIPPVTNTGQQLNVICKEGYTPDKELPVCENGTWTANPVSLCKESSCAVPKLDNGDVLEENKGEFYFNLKKLQYDRDVLHIKIPEGKIVTSGTSYLFFCHPGYVVQRTLIDRNDIVCTGGKWLPEPACEIDKTGNKGEKLTTPIPTDPTLLPTKSTSVVSPSPRTAIPVDGTDESEPSKCSCKYLPKDENLIASVHGKQLKQQHGVKKGAEVVFRCLHVGFHRFIGIQEMKCEDCKQWNATHLPKCAEPKAGNTIILFERNVNISEEGHLEVWKGQKVTLICVGVESAMYPSWNVPNANGVTITRRREGENSEVEQYMSELKLESANEENEGPYECAIENNPDTTIELFVIDPNVRCPEFEEDGHVEVTYSNERHVRGKAYFSCRNKGEDLIGKTNVRCLNTGEWSGPAPKCQEPKCKNLKETGLLNIYYTEDRKIGSFATFHCTAPGERSGVPFARCLENGLWSDPLPTCQNANDINQPFLPKGEGTTKPGSSADDSGACYCTYNYQTRLISATVGNKLIDAKSRVRKGEVVTFSCLYHGMYLKWSNGLRLMGPVNVTCEECEKLKEPELPICEIRKLGVNLLTYNDKMKISPGGVVEVPRGENINIQCINFRAPPKWNINGRDGIHFSNEFTLPTMGTAGFFSSSMLISDVDDEHAGRYECLAPVNSASSLDLRIYDDEKSPRRVKTSTQSYTLSTEPSTSPIEYPDECFCTFDNPSLLLLVTSGRNRKIERGEPVAKDEVISLNCRHPKMIMKWKNGLKISGEVNLTCTACEKWRATELPTCEVESVGSSSVVYNNKMKILPGGVIEIPRGESFEFRCVNNWVQPMWDAGDREGTYFESSVNRKKDLYSTYMLIYEAEDEHAGVYRCFATDQIRVYEGAKMEIKLSDDGIDLETTTSMNAVTTSSARPISVLPDSTSTTRSPVVIGGCYCTYNYDSHFVTASVNNAKLESGKRVPKNTVVSFSCQDPDMSLQWPNELKFYGTVNLICNACEKWKRRELPTCDFVDEDDSLLVYDDKMKILPNGVIEVSKGDSIEIRCVNAQAQPEWDVDGRGGIYFSSDSNAIRAKTGLYSSYMLIDEVSEEHAGLYKCFSSQLRSTTLHLQISGSNLQCPELPTSTDRGDFVITYDNERKIDSIAQYKCQNDAYILVGDDSRECLEDRQWSGTSPYCKAPKTQCPYLETITKRGNFLITYENDRKISTSAYYSCQDKAQKLVGGRQRTCLENGKWSGKEPSCKEITCPYLPLHNGLLAFYSNDNKVKSIAKFRCPHSTSLVGSTSSVCQADGTWSKAVPSCENYISCNRFETPLGLEVSYSNQAHIGSRASFRCLPPHHLVGSSFATCLDGGIWSELQPICEGIPVCRLNRNLSPELIIQPLSDYYRLGDFALLSCPPGQILEPNTERMLCHGEEWSHEFPECIVANDKE